MNVKKTAGKIGILIVAFSSVSLIFSLAAHADEYSKIMGWQTASSLAFAAETAQIGRCQLSVSRIDNGPYSDPNQPAKITLTDGNGASESVVIQPSDSFDAQDIVLSGAAIRIVTGASGNLTYQRNSDLFFIQIAGLQCGARL